MTAQTAEAELEADVMRFYDDPYGFVYPQCSVLTSNRFLYWNHGLTVLRLRLYDYESGRP